MSKIKLYPHQEEGLRRVLKEPFYFLFMEQGTGKTAVAIRSLEERYKRGEVNRVIIFAPNSILLNWEMELGRFLGIPKKDYIIHRMNQRTKSKRLEAYGVFMGSKKKLSILILNYEKARVMEKELKKYKPEMVIIDEGHKLRNRTAQISKKIYRLTRPTSYRLLMTGTPVCNGYEDLFMQYKLVDEDILGSNYKDFESDYIVRGGYMNYSIVGYRNEKRLKRIIRKTSFRVKIEDCIKLPELTHQYLTCELGPKSQKAYNEINKDMLTQVDRVSKIWTRAELKELCKKHNVLYSSKDPYSSLLIKASPHLSDMASCDLIITKVMRLQQITGGHLTLDDGEVISLGTEKLDLLIPIVESAKRPLIIFCQYVAEVELIKSQLHKLNKGIRVESYRDVKTRDRVYKDFQSGKIDVLILQLSSGSVGLNLQIADKLVFYSWGYSADTYVQAIARIKRTGQKNPMEIIHLVAENTIDMDILNIVKAKRELAQKILD